jgi:hypothetical protein
MLDTGFENLTGLIGAVSRGCALPPEEAARNAPPVHVVVHQGHERRWVASVERVRCLAKAVDHHIRCYRPSSVTWHAATRRCGTSSLRTPEGCGISIARRNRSRATVVECSHGSSENRSLRMRLTPIHLPRTGLSDCRSRDESDQNPRSRPSGRAGPPAAVFAISSRDSRDGEGACGWVFPRDGRDGGRGSGHELA